MRGKQPGKELEALKAGLAVAKGEDYIPPEVEEQLVDKTPEDLLELGEMGQRLENAVKVRNGWVYIMLRRKVGHGNFKKYLQEHDRPYMKVWECMCYARAVNRFPGLSGALAGRALRHVLSLPVDEIHKIEEQITGIPAEEAKKISRNWIEKEYRKIQAEKERPKRKAREVNDDDLPTELDSLVADAQEALIKIYELKISQKHHERAARYRTELQAAWDRASYNLRDPEHKTTPIWETKPLHDDVSE